MDMPKPPALDPAAPSPIQGALQTIDERSREIFRRIVDSYLATGEPVGSRNLSRIIPMTLSPASVRNVMADLEALGLLYAPHTSAGRMPTEAGLRFFVDACMEFGDPPQEDQSRIEAQVRAGGQGQALNEVLAEATQLLSGLSRGAGVLLTSKQNKRLKHVEFVRLDPAQALVVLVGEDGSVENRVLPLPPGLPASALVEAGNYLNSRLRGRTLGEVRTDIERAHAGAQGELDQLTAKLVEAGLASWAGEGKAQLIVRGQANLLGDLRASDDLERIRHLFDDLETQSEVIELLTRAEAADGVRIYIGSENRLSSFAGSSMIAAPFRDGQKRIVGVIGIIGPTRLNYGRIVPMVDYTARIVSRLIERKG